MIPQMQIALHLDGATPHHQPRRIFFLNIISEEESATAWWETTLLCSSWQNLQEPFDTTQNESRLNRLSPGLGLNNVGHLSPYPSHLVSIFDTKPNRDWTLEVLNSWFRILFWIKSQLIIPASYRKNSVYVLNRCIFPFNLFEHFRLSCFLSIILMSIGSKKLLKIRFSTWNFSLNPSLNHIRMSEKFMKFTEI